MSQFVIEFGSERLDPIASSVALCLPLPHDISVDEAGKELHYVASGEPLAQVVVDLELELSLPPSFAALTNG